ncbi:MAG: hypothetical protein SVX43_23195 [Cyanobacteriota bacterium]|nr:hypothetical protein [Cyanobacteriota bacterium]
MLAPLLFNLAVAAVAVYLTFNTHEEIIKVAATFVAIVCLFLCLFFAPLFVKLLVLTLPFVVEKFRRNEGFQENVER